MAIDLLPFLQAVKQIEVPPSYTYEAGVGRYRNTKTGYFVARKVIERLLNDTEAATGQTLRALATALAQHRLPAKAWHLAMQQQLGRLHLQGAALGAGGFAALTPAALRRIEDALQADSERLFAFGEAIDAGAISEKQIINRIHMYIGNARLQYYHALPPPKTKAGHVVIERRVLRAGDNCDWCVYLAGLGWQPYGTLPLPGQAGADWVDGQCLTNCRCHIERKSVARRVADRLVRPLTAEFEPEAGHRHIIKGGPGSGHFGHAGIPEHQGGSLPSEGTHKVDAADLLARLKKEKAAKKPKAPKRATFRVPKTDKTPVDDAIRWGEWDGDPLIRLAAGTWDREQYADDPLGWLDAQREANKDWIVNHLTEVTSLTYDEANEFVGQWAETSNDHDLRSLRIQEAAAAEFGVPLTDWQKERLAVSNEQRANVLTDFFNTLDDERWDGEESVSLLRRKLADYATWSTPFELDALRALENDLRRGDDDVVDSDDLWSRLETLGDEAGAKVREALRATYAETQKQLAQAGIKEVHLYRGVRQPNADLAAYDEGDTFKAQTNALSSWSFALDPADMFMRGEDDEYMTGMVLDAVVPASRIFSTAATGPGCLTEWEMVVIGGKADPVRAKRVLRSRNAKAAALVGHRRIIKGGPGSGHFNHAGIPEHQGGSLPSNGGGAYNPTMPDWAVWDVPKAKPKAKPKKAKQAKGRAAFRIPTGNDLPVDDALLDHNYGGHPLLAATIGEFDANAYADQIEWQDAQAEKHKEAVVAELSEALGMTNDEANEFVVQWAATANDNDLRSLTIQELAAEEFGIPLTAWQREKLAEVQEKRNQKMDRVFDGIADDDIFFDTYDATDAVFHALRTEDDLSYPFEVLAFSALMDEADHEELYIANKDELREKLDDIELASRDKVRKALRFTYDQTQKFLAENGIKEVHLFRGGIMPEAAGVKEGDTFNAQTNPLSSWSFAQEIARSFMYGANGPDAAGGEALVVDAIVPASRIYSTAATGPGCLLEWEMIVLGSESDTVRAAKVSRVKKSTKAAGRIVKGGEGSGHFNHAGIPEHQGGSLPSKGPKGGKGKTKPDPEKEAMRKRAKTAKDNIAKLMAQLTGQAPPTAATPKPKAAAKPKAKKPKAADLVESTTKPAATATGFKVPTEPGAPLDDAIIKEEYRTNPLLRVLTGNVDVPDGPYMVGRMQKASVAAKVNALAKGIGISKEEADFFYAEWSQSSNTSLFSMGVQAEAAAEFGSPLTAWQKRKTAEMEEYRESELADVRFELSMKDEWDGPAAAEKLHDKLGYSLAARPFEAEGLRQLRDDAQSGKVKIKDEADLWRRVDAINAAGLEKTRKALRFTYAQTQAQLKAAGITEVRLFRGMKVPGKAMAEAAEGSAGRIESNTLSSWSASYETASSFGYLEPEGTRVVLDAIVPASRIYSTAGSGQGSMNEWEMVVLGSPDDTVRVYKRIGN